VGVEITAKFYDFLLKLFSKLNDSSSFKKITLLEKLQQFH